MRKQCRAQMDLFLPVTRPGDRSGAERQKAVALLRVLLTEAAAKPPTSLRPTAKMEQAMSKITLAHLARAAFVYIRQSTAYQVVNNLESQRRQYGLVERARELGWEDVQLVDDDLGRSGGGGGPARDPQTDAACSSLSAADRARLMTLGQDLTKAWNSPVASIETRKKIIRLFVKEIIVDVVGDTIGAHHSLARRRPHPVDGQKEQNRTDPLDGRSRCPRSRSRIGEAIIGHGNRCDPQSVRQADCTWCELDTIPRLQSPENQRHSCLPQM
ncbi:hypothetical protein [Bradyrhizobium sp. RDI18]|uniref:hypothetical protein n=1 Tax=Bradyrhizobium sp. RDI18 TaxID=3367400 RepID=UPI0037165C3A